MSETKTYQRVLRIIIFGTFLLVSISLLAKLISYFKTGADITSSLHLTEEKLSEHSPITSWLADDPNNPTPTDEFIKSEISKAYVNAWQAISLSKEAQYKIALDDFFTDSLEYHISRNNFTNPDLEQIDIQHDLQLHLLSYDRQLVAFSDTAIVLEQFKSDSKQYLTEHKAVYQVIMTFEDGRWKVREMELRSKTPRNESSVTQVSAKLPNNGINYYPTDTPWDLFWLSYNNSIIEADLSKIKALGFESVRIFIDFEKFGKGHIDYNNLERLNHFLDAADESALNVMVTLFDMPLGFELKKYPMYISQLDALVSSIKDHPALMAWDLKNEPDIDYQYHDRNTVNNWLAYMLKYLKRIDDKTPVTIGWSTYQYACNLSSKLDFVSFHYYDDPSELVTKINELKACTKEKQIVISEYGRSSAMTSFGSKAIQAKYNDKIKSISNDHDITLTYIWCYSDFNHAPSHVFGMNPITKWKQKKFGIVDINGELKKQ